MAYGYQMPQNGNIQTPQQTIPQQGQNVQPLFPQPNGNVYSINSTLEVANVPVGAGMSIALCLPENIMYIKTMQNGNPLFYPYKIEPLTTQSQSQQGNEEQTDFMKQISEQIKAFDERISALEKDKKKAKGGFDL